MIVLNVYWYKIKKEKNSGIYRIECRTPTIEVYSLIPLTSGFHHLASCIIF
jgi:hypothetical protein